ncbi:UDP-glucosyltransferase 2-like [Onthophagus taurus]|uniref:UDP-glucosyltransferase 2-like n=1 Tax=Onthophagus taurus TaxID=166361 RepID=UPI0039BDFEEA
MKVLLPSFFLTYVQCANILFVGFYPSKSHQEIFQAIWTELSLRGHKLTVLSPNPIKDPSLVNVTEIDLSDVYRIEGTKNTPSLRSKEFATKDGIAKLFDFMETIVEYELCNPDVRSLIVDNRKDFDVAIIEIHHPAMLAFGYKFNCPVIGISSLGIFTSAYNAMGNPINLGLYPELVFQKRLNLTFWERLQSTYDGVWFKYFYENTVMSRADEIVKMHFGLDTPYIGDLERNISLLLLNMDPIFYSPRPVLPTLINLGHIYIKSDQELAKDFKEDLDEAKEGVIYINLESSIKLSNMTHPLLSIIVKDLSDLPYKIVWKWSSEYLPGRPENVVIKKWIPQQALLGHRNVKAFVTRGSLSCIEEAIMNGVPLIGIPFADDQHINVDDMVRVGAGLQLNPFKLKRGQLRKTILEVAENRKYRENMIKVAKIKSDDFMTGVERAVWWTEYVIRHKGTDHLRSPIQDVPLYQYFLLDVICFTLVGILLILCTSYKVMSIIYNAPESKKKKKKKSKKKKKRNNLLELVQYNNDLILI